MFGVFQHLYAACPTRPNRPRRARVPREQASAWSLFSGLSLASVRQHIMDQLRQHVGHQSRNDEHSHGQGSPGKARLRECVPPPPYPPSPTRAHCPRFCLPVCGGPTSCHPVRALSPAHSRGPDSKYFGHKVSPPRGLIFSQRGLSLCAGSVSGTVVLLVRPILILIVAHTHAATWRRRQVRARVPQGQPRMGE